jgi:YidC/Oxa1 family membrane protein insertase
MMLCLLIFFLLQIFDPFDFKNQLKPDAEIPAPVGQPEDLPKLHPTGHPRQFFTLGSLAADSSDCLLVTLDTRGAAVRRIELIQRSANGRFLTKEVENKSGYLGYLELESDGAPGSTIRALPAGSPLTQATAEGQEGRPVTVGDRLLSLDGQAINSDQELTDFLRGTRGGQTVTARLARPLQDVAAGGREPIAEETADVVGSTADVPTGDGERKWQEYSVSVTLMDRPKQMLGPEYRLVSGEEASYPGTLEFSLQDTSQASNWKELDLAMQHGNWEGRQFVDAAGRQCIEFSYRLPKAVFNRLLKSSETLTSVLAPAAGDEETAEEAAAAQEGAVVVVKRYRLPSVEEAQRHDPAAAGYHVEMEVEIVNHAPQPLEIAYRLGGPVATSIEGWWYQIKLHGGFWKIGYSAGARDIVTSSVDRPYNFFGRAEITAEIEKDRVFPIFPRDGKVTERTVRYAAVDTLYFASALLPQAPAVPPADTAEGAQDPASPGYVCYSGFAGPIGKPLPGRDAMQQDLSFRLYNTASLPPHSSSPTAVDGPTEAETAEGNDPPTTVPNQVTPIPGYRQTFHLFAGPKRPELLATYKLDDTVSFGWFGMFSLPLLWLLHFFYYLIGNYAIAIILLTVVVRLLMMPISRKAVINAQMMQALAPEMKKIKEKYPDNLEKQGLAQRELFRRFKYNPFSGCLIVFLQLPIFIGLYRGLSVDFELRDQPLIPGVSWCSNMAGPDQLWNWSEYLPGFIAAETGWLGPYFNLLPILTIILFIAQQKIFMPPPTDEQQAMMQKMMSYMMIFMGFLFFKVPAGLCIYFITSSIWGLIERAVIPKPQLSQAILDSIQRDADAPPAVVAKPLAAEGKTQLDEKSRQELRERERERQRRLKDRRKE